MNPTTAPKTNAAEVIAPPLARMTSATFVNAISFGTMLQSVAIDSTVANRVDSITPARLETDGSAVAIGPNQRADGLLLTCRKHDTRTNKPITLRAWVPFSNVAYVTLAE